MKGAASRSGGMELRPYQARDVRRIRAAFGRVRRVLYVLPTGGGKTNVAASLVASWRRADDRILFLAHRRELVNQAVERLISCGMSEQSIGVVMGDDRRAHPYAPVQVASVDTLRRRDLPPADRIIIDEAHHATAPGYRLIADGYPRAKILGLTAIPYRLDGKGLDEAFDDMVVGASPLELIAEGYLSRPRVWTVPDDLLPDLRGVRASRGEYEPAGLDKATNRPRIIGGIVEHWLRHAKSRRTVVFAVNVAHAKKIAAAFLGAGIPTEHLDGETPTAERDATLARLRSGETKVVTNCSVLTEGWDSPKVKCAVLARPTKSKGLSLQMAGRILRPWGGVTPIILDHSGNMVQHGLPQMDRPFSLAGEADERFAGEAPAKACPECHSVVHAAATVCEVCGHEFAMRHEPEEADGELTEVGPSEEEKRAALARIQGVATAKGFGADWVIATYRRLFDDAA